jgi:ATP-dependent protease ClpP protease subunit
MSRAIARAVDVAARRRDAVGPRALFAKAATGNSGDLHIYEAIGEDWWTGGGVTSAKVKDALAALKGVKTLNVYINSEGGDVFEAKAIYEQLQRFDAEKVVYVDGIAASAATFIAMAGDRIITAPFANWMIHEAWSGAVGNAADLRAMADLLDLQNRNIAGMYAQRSGRGVDEFLALMAAETWLDAQGAKDLGLTDEIAREDDTAGQSAAAKASPLVAAAARTKELVRSVSPAELLAARASMRRSAHQSNRASPVNRSDLRPPGGATTAGNTTGKGN